MESPTRVEGDSSKILVRDWFSGEPIQKTVDAENSNSSSWHGKPDKLKGDATYSHIPFQLEKGTGTGQTVEFQGKYYEITDPKFKHLSDRWGENAVFAKEITAEEYNQLQK